ncbi:uncharacterized protein LOC114290858 isoform X4 [Camellia sinensis]|uniref:uncharacterized protein LOC114290858 isoform X4 n=1 Tax=Camellia sinensis TaxID=4442 RepID=UPI0010360C07|nr:uncharacterized protein LOC114290858 isoform X4 [Camellia sinensis]
MSQYFQSLIPRNNPILLPYTNNHNPKPFNTIQTFQSHSLSFSLFLPKLPNNARTRLHSLHHHHHPHRSFHSRRPKTTHFILETLILCIFSLTLLSLRLASTVLLPDFPRRWHQLIAFSEDAESKFISHYYPSHLWQALVAYEDRRFFQHFGIDPVGIARAVFSFSARGGGSTITQQIYWGHGIYGVEMASKFYFGKHPTLLCLGECAMLVGIIPAPELRSPLRDTSRGKTFQARVLKRMVEVGFLDMETALLVVKQNLHLRVDRPHHGSGLLLPSSSSGKEKEDKHSTLSEIWDWQIQSKIWEVQEDMGRWAVRIQEKNKKEEQFGS